MSSPAVSARLALPGWRGGVTLRAVSSRGTDLSSYRLFGIVLDAEPDEDALTYLEQIVGYAWAANMTGVPPIGDGRVSVHGTVVVVDADIAFRRSRSRSREQATRDLITQTRDYYAAGSPARKNGTRLVERPDDVTLPEVVGFMVG